MCHDTFTPTPKSWNIANDASGVIGAWARARGCAVVIVPIGQAKIELDLNEAP